MRGCLRPVLADRASARRRRRRKAGRRAVRPRQAGGDRLADRAARGDRGRGQRVLDQPRPLGERHPGVHDGRRDRLPPSRVGQPGGRRDAGGSHAGSRRASSPTSPSRRTARRIAVDVVQNGINTIWVKQLPAGPFSRLTFGDTANLRPTWSADGRSVVYLGERVHQRRYSRRCAAPTAPAARERLLPVGSRWGQALPDPRRQVAGAADARSSRRVRATSSASRMGDTTLVPLANSAGDRGRRGGVAGRAVAGVRLGRVRGQSRSTCVPSPTPRRRGGRCRSRAGPIRCGRTAGGSCSISAGRTR